MIAQKEVEPSSGGCEICKQPTDVLNIIPQKRPDGSLISLACTKCAEESGMYCVVHQSPHIGFEDGETSACIRCIEEEVEKNGVEISTSFLNGVEKSPYSFDTLTAMSQYVSLTAKLTGSSKSHCIARAVVTAAQRFKKSPEEVLSETFQKGPSILFPESAELHS